jgi:fructose-1,6-bisphosphatase/inositol monophosphatase family enzyme
VSRKGPADFVSMADKRAEQTLVEELRHARPDWGFHLEEGGTIAGDPDKPRWIIDPIDGTSNFLHGIPHFAMSIAVEDPRGAGGKPEITQGLIYQPLTDESFWAGKGQGRLAQRAAPSGLLAARSCRRADRDRDPYSDMAISTVPEILDAVSPKWPASGASAPPRSISPGSRPAA